MKECSSCKEIKSFESFTKNKARPSGYHNQCKQCRKEYYDRVDYGKNMWKKPGIKEKMTKSHLAWQERNRDKYNAYMREYRKSGKVDYTRPQILAYGAKRRAANKAACPQWVDKEHQLKIERIYRLRKRLSKVLNQELEVDHIYPLVSDVCSGLHVWWNLQIIPKELNRSKGNKILPENIMLPRVSEDSFEVYLHSQFKIYADLYRNKDIELLDKKPVG